MPRLIAWRDDRPSLAARAVVVGGGLAAFSTFLPWFSYGGPDGSTDLLGLHDVTGKAMLLAGLAELAFGLLYRRGGSVPGRRILRGAMVVVGFFMISVPLAAMAHAGAVPGAPPDATDASGAIGTVVALLAAFVVLGASWLTVLDPPMAYRRAP